MISDILITPKGYKRWTNLKENYIYIFKGSSTSNDYQIRNCDHHLVTLNNKIYVDIYDDGKRIHNSWYLSPGEWAWFEMKKLSEYEL